jgi:DeoR/GlpR family transcriptional regulator of sugar metabolism
MTAEAMLDIVRTRHSATVGDLSRELGVSEATVRRGLRRLAASGAIVRTYGGAVAAHAVPGPGSVDRLDQRHRIGLAAAELIRDGETVVIGSGRTTLAVARQLTARRELTVITNALDVAMLLVDVPGVDVIVLGGSVRPGMHSLLGHLTEQAAAELRADRLIMGIPAFDPDHGLTSDHLPEILTDRALRRMAREVILVADSSKYGRVEPALVLPLDDVDVLVTDEGLPAEAVAAVEARGVKVVLA